MPKTTTTAAELVSPITKSSVQASDSTQLTTSSEPLPRSGEKALQSGIDLMTRFAVRRGLSLPAPLNTVAAIPLPSDNVGLYNTLVDIIKPATIQSIRFIDAQVIEHKEGEMRWYKIPIFTKCITIAAIALVALVGISLLPTVNEENLSKGLLFSSGTVLLANLIFVCSASLLGVMFYLLKTVSDKIKNYSLLPIDAIEVNTTILIGMISGFIISELLSFQSGALGGNVELHKMTLALLGGFSADAIFTVLQGIVNKAKSFLVAG